MPAIEIIRYPELASTNDEAKRLLKVGNVTQPVCVVAYHQTSGKGTQGRVWLSPKGTGLTFSLLIPVTATRPMIPADPMVTKLVGLALVSVFSEQYDVNTKIKPINDIYAQHPIEKDWRKLAGILVEGVSQGGKCLGLIIGVGINIYALQPHYQQAIQADSVNQALPMALSQLVIGSIQEDILLEACLACLDTALESFIQHQGYQSHQSREHLEHRWQQHILPDNR